MVSALEPGIVCADIDNMLQFYTKVLGLRFSTDAEASAQMSAAFGAAPNGFRIIRLITPYGERIKLVQPKQTSIQKNERCHWVFEGQGIAYLTFVVDDVEEVTALLRDNHVALMSEGPVEIRKGIMAIFACDPEGNYLEFVQYEDLAAYQQNA
jgi:catechol 2,3-dioxygenase-like lactoylglutathione lyase family enzyme